MKSTQFYALTIIAMFLYVFLFNFKTATANPASKIAFEQHINDLYFQCDLKNNAIDKQLFRHTMIGYYNLLAANKIKSEKRIISIVDFRKPSDQQRFYVIDLDQKKVLYQTLVSHGENTGLLYARYFSNKTDSFQSSLGWFLTAESYRNTANGYGMRLDGLEKGYNDKARSRNIVVHAAPYVSETYIQWHGSLGRSQGCPTLPEDKNEEIINLIKGGTCFFQYYDDLEYLNKSKFMSSETAANYFVNMETETNSQPNSQPKTQNPQPKQQPTKIKPWLLPRPRITPIPRPRVKGRILLGLQ